jgi:hypothetical protein
MDYIFAAISPQFLLQFAILKVLTTQWAMVFMNRLCQHLGLLLHTFYYFLFLSMNIVYHLGRILVKWFSILPGLFLGYNQDVSSILFPWSLWRTECWFPNLLVKHKQDASMSFLFLLFEIVAYKKLELSYNKLISSHRWQLIFQLVYFRQSYIRE